MLGYGNLASLDSGAAHVRRTLRARNGAQRAAHAARKLGRPLADHHADQRGCPWRLHRLQRLAGARGSSLRYSCLSFAALSGACAVTPFLRTHALHGCMTQHGLQAWVGISMLHQSDLHKNGPMVSGMPVNACVQAEKKYVPFKAYAQSKLANVMAVSELNRRCNPKASSTRRVTANSVHPGLVDTPLARGYFLHDYLSPVPGPLKPLARPAIKALMPVVLLPPQLSVLSVVHAALGDDDAVAGQFVQGQRAAKLPKAAQDGEACAQLWDTSCALAGITNQILVHGAP